MASSSAPPPPGPARPSQLETQRPEATPTFRRREGTTHRGFGASGTAHGLGPTRRDVARTTTHGAARPSQLETQRPERPRFVPFSAAQPSAPSTRLHGIAALLACGLVAVLGYQQCSATAPDEATPFEASADGAPADVESVPAVEAGEGEERTSLELPARAGETREGALGERAWPRIVHRSGGAGPGEICQVPWLEMYERTEPSAGAASGGERASTPLMRAAENGSLAELEQLLAAGAVVDERDGLNRTALMYAAERGRDAQVAALMRAGADGRTRGLWDESGGSMSALDAAFRARALDTARLIERDVLASFARLEGADLAAIDEAGDTPLHWVARYADARAAQLLVGRGAALEAKNCPARSGDERGLHAGDLRSATPLLVAIWAGNVDVARQLIDAGANARAVDELGRGVFHVMRHPESLALTAELLRAGADPLLPDRAAQSPAEALSASGLRMEYARALAAAGRPIATPIATFADVLGVIGRLGRGRGADPGDPAPVLALLEGNALLVAESDASGRTLLFEAARHGLARVADALIARGAGVDARDRSGATPLHVAANGETISVLARAGANVNARDRSGATPLHVAAVTRGSLDALEALLAAGADARLRDARGRTALELAQRSGDAEMATRLESAR